MNIDYPAAYGGFARAYQGIDDQASSLSRHDLLGFSRCRGWALADVLHHVPWDAQRTLIGLAGPAPGPADVDFVTYWRAFADGLAAITIRTPPHAEALALAVATLNGLAGPGAPRPPAWTVEEYLLKATGRLAPAPDERAAAAGYPLLR